MKPTLVIMAAGMASRYGSMKQIQQFGPSGETIMDYSIFDAIRAGFGKVVFIIRKDFAEDFKAIFEPKLAGKIQTAYVYQELSRHLGEFTVPEGRTKPWGTAHAVLCASEEIQEPFAVINADDFYGKDAFAKAYDFLTTQANEHVYALIGYDLRNTLSENGSVSRGVCQVSPQGNMVAINERTKIYRGTDGGIVFEEDAVLTPLAEDAKVSMNFWCFAPSLFSLAQEMFFDFLRQHRDNPKSEIYLTNLADEFVKRTGNEIRVIPTDSKWFGVTYKEDAPGVTERIHELVAKGEYPGSLWGS